MRSGTLPSLSGRLLFAASVVLAAFLGLTGLALDRAFRESVEAAVHDRLEAQIFMLLGAADFQGESGGLLPESLPDPRFSTPGSGLYALVLNQGKVLWRSQSLLGMSMTLGAPPAPGAWEFGSGVASDGTPLLALQFTAIWEPAESAPIHYTFAVGEARQVFERQMSSFRRSLWGWLAAVALLLLVVQATILRWGLKPLREIALEVLDIEAGRRPALEGRYPRELKNLADNLNALVRNSQRQLERYRDSLGDLAHSLKTPLAVLRTGLEREGSREELQATVREQVDRLTQTVEYQLQRAAAAGRKVLTAPVAVAPVVTRTLQSLAKVYADKKLELAGEVEPGIRFAGDEGDLFEIVGNLADNACKWARHHVHVAAREETPGGRLIIEVEDDGPGIPADQVESLLARGARADESTAGHGIGLAVVQEIARGVYAGRIEIGRSALGGAAVKVLL